MDFSRRVINHSMLHSLNCLNYLSNPYNNKMEVDIVSASLITLQNVNWADSVKLFGGDENIFIDGKDVGYRTSWILTRN